ncbi:hypothetical protein BMG03_01045 [Thioclava nitratireducens]|uniref:DUF1127 domain-containing protein n=1 Tax=Thioclava nitratireducens TaxID=1915078 RepID=A0ABM6ICY0_9RHOB|nr:MULTISPECIES: hypothetical protein [Thioclava]AQS46542.1 hypothetical protein BMG03_01045 [Thioclava nitratireducens]PWE50078.1 hypothetical protein DEM26_09000 [Thioclava sp. NG1]
MISRHEAEACRRIFVSVLLLAIRDMFGRNPDALLTKQARSWIGTRDFCEVCTLAGYDWRRVERALRRRLEQARGLTAENRRADVALVTLASMEISA